MIHSQSKEWHSDPEYVFAITSRARSAPHTSLNLVMVLMTSYILPVTSAPCVSSAHSSGIFGKVGLLAGTVAPRGDVWSPLDFCTTSDLDPQPHGGSLYFENWICINSYSPYVYQNKNNPGSCWCKLLFHQHSAHYSWPCTFTGFNMHFSHAHMYILRLVCVTSVQESIARKKVSIRQRGSFWCKLLFHQHSAQSTGSMHPIPDVLRWR